MDKAAKIEAIYRYPVKGLSAESLASTRLTLGETIAADRLYAIENGPSGFDPAAPAYLPKQRFLMLMRNERLARLEARFDVATHVLAIELEGARVVCGDLRTPTGRASIERFFGEFCADELRGPPRVLHGNGHSFSDVARKVVSIINLASVAAIEDAIGAPVRSAALSRQPLCRGLAGVARVRAAGSRDRRRRGRAGEDRQAHPALRGNRGRSSNRRPRSADPRDAVATLRPWRLRGLRRGGRGRRDRAGRCGGGRLSQEPSSIRTVPFPLLWERVASCERCEQRAG